MKMSQSGQAIVEMLVVTTAILMLLWGLLWLQRWQQIKLQTQHHAALQAFRFSQSYELDLRKIRAESAVDPVYLKGLYSPIAHTEHSQAQALGVMPAQHSLLSTAQEEGILGATERWRFHSKAHAHGTQSSAWAQRLFEFVPKMTLNSQTSIWVGAGHANDDTQAVQRLEASQSLWAYAQPRSKRVIDTLTPLLSPVDMAWGRPSPSTDWILPWQESVPIHHLKQK